jgi:hypothetical protein
VIEIMAIHYLACLTKTTKNNFLEVLGLSLQIYAWLDCNGSPDMGQW